MYIHLYPSDGGDWWEARHVGQRNSGYIPVNHVKEVTVPVESTMQEKPPFTTRPAAATPPPSSGPKLKGKCMKTVP